MNTDAGLQLWMDWFKQDGNPWIGDTTDYGRQDKCFFCVEEKPNHSTNCIYVKAKYLLTMKAAE
jgi:hypothetical protein